MCEFTFPKRSVPASGPGGRYILTGGIYDEIDASLLEFDDGIGRLKQEVAAFIDEMREVMRLWTEERLSGRLP